MPLVLLLVPVTRWPVVFSLDATQMLATPLVVIATWSSNAHSKSVYRLLCNTETVALSRQLLFGQCNMSCVQTAIHSSITAQES